VALGPKPVSARGHITGRLIAAALLALASGCSGRGEQPPAGYRPHGEAAADYLEGLARESQVARSELLPVSLSREGGFLLERGEWHLGYRNYTLASRYTLRWRETPAGWKVVLWRWTLFR
jgi:hypothetical protein